ncbi:MAG: fused response regulator/phosphatase [Magnetococcales bacterium]|nr:fused response regulator/phosphatase [Magnetococcales bacterium]MBF0155685.1 fused response regulator/phosphatase [Magnetococcales bacterium]
MKILVVDDDRVNSTILNRLLGRAGHPVITAGNGRDGVALFAQEQPDLVLMDIRMPQMNGYEAARRMKSIAADRFVPIIFLTAVTDDEGLAQCIEAGGDDFLTKPFNRIILQAKIDAMERIQQLHSVLRSQKEQLLAHQESVRQELEIGQHLFSNIVRAGNLLDAPCLSHWTSPMSLFNGDLLMASYNPAGGLHILLGDFTGHGLSAAVGALPLSEIFYGMTAQGFSIGDMVEEMNAKLLKVLPARMFCAACLIEVDFRQESLTVWNGGLPDILIANADGLLVSTIPSGHLPLGIVPMNREERKVELIEMQRDFRVFLYSDGLTEATDPNGEMYGQKRLMEQFSGATPPGGLFRGILDDLDRFRSGAAQSDDISLLEIDCSRGMEEPPGGAQHTAQKRIPPSRWEVAFAFDADTLKSVDPLPTIISALMNLQAPSGHRERIYTILAELFSNALDHGLLQLDTRTKQTPEGFVEYYAQREKRLAQLSDGLIRVTLRHAPIREEGRLSGEVGMRVEDSGLGFDHAVVRSMLAGNLSHGGRGIALVRSLCTRLDYHGNGNIAEATYRWDYQ